MTCYIVSFQVKEVAVRQRLREKLRTYAKYCPINDTCWAVVSDKKATDVRDELKDVLAPGDRIFVIRSGTEAAWRSAISPKHSEWLKKNL